MGTKFRAASISIASPREEGEGYDYSNGGVIFGDSEYPGSASILLEIDHPEGLTDDDGYPIRGRAVAINFRFPEDEDGDAEEYAIELDGCYLNATFWHEIERSPKAKGGKSTGGKRKVTRRRKDSDDE